MSWRMMLSGLRRNSLMPALVLLQVALACAILCNLLFLMWHKLAPMLAPSGVADSELVLVDQLGAEHPWTAAEVQAGEDSLRRVPGVRAASAAFGLPMVSNTMMVLEMKGDDGVKLAVNGYSGRGLVGTLGLKLVDGRDFLPSEYRPFDGAGTDTGALQPVIITRALADKLFVDGHAVGKTLADPDDPNAHGYQVVGVVQHLLRNQLSMAVDGHADDTVLLGQYIGKSNALNFAVRVDPAMREVALRGVTAAVHRQFDATTDANNPVRVGFYSERRDAEFKRQRAALWLFAGITGVVVAVTLIGIMGLTGFWVQKRTRQIGIRRALGARRSDILRLFLVENAFIVSIGAVVGMLLAHLGNRLLMQHYELPQLPASYLLIGAGFMLLLGQLAVLGPARRAAAVPPVVATRSV